MFDCDLISGDQTAAADDPHNCSFETVLDLLNTTRPDFIPSVPDHWLAQPRPSLFVRATISVVFSCLAIPGNASQILVLVTFLK